jgi:hypothetical protein
MTCLNMVSCPSFSGSLVLPASPYTCLEEIGGQPPDVLFGPSYTGIDIAAQGSDLFPIIAHPDVVYDLSNIMQYK